jgi:hypothetical protein
VAEKGFISFAARNSRGAETAERRETEQTFFVHQILARVF